MLLDASANDAARPWDHGRLNVECNLDGDPHYHQGGTAGPDLCRLPARAFSDEISVVSLGNQGAFLSPRLSRTRILTLSWSRVCGFTGVLGGALCRDNMATQGGF